MDIIKDQFAIKQKTISTHPNLSIWQIWLEIDLFFEITLIVLCLHKSLYGIIFAVTVTSLGNDFDNIYIYIYII